MTDKKTRPKPATPPAAGYDAMLSGVAGLLEEARRTSARAVNAIMTATYWEIGRRIVEYEQGGKDRAGYGKELIARLSADLTARFGRGFGPVNLSQMRRFYQSWPPEQIFQMASEKFVPAPPTGIASLHDIAARFPLPWSHYVRLMSVKTPHARTFYETEALRGGWSGPQLDRQFVGLRPPIHGRYCFRFSLAQQSKRFKAVHRFYWWAEPTLPGGATWGQIFNLDRLPRAFLLST